MLEGWGNGHLKVRNANCETKNGGILHRAQSKTRSQKSVANMTKTGFSRIALLAAGLSTMGLAALGLWVEPNRIEVRRVTVTDRRLHEVLAGKTVVHISDLHMSGWSSREQAVQDILDGLSPDLLFVTGDLIQWNGEGEAALTFLSRLHAKTGVWAVMGDYDYSNSRKSCVFCHEAGSGAPTRRHGVRFLRNSGVWVTLERGALWIGGMDAERGGKDGIMEWWRSGTNEMSGMMEYWNDGRVKGCKDAGQEYWKDGSGRRPPKGAAMILLSHSPLVFDLISEDEDVFVLAGDTHGGQISLPSWIWSLLGYEKNARYEQGLYEVGKKKMFVTRGIGTSQVPFRLFRRPEVVVFQFRE